MRLLPFCYSGRLRSAFTLLAVLTLTISSVSAQGTRLLRQPSVNDSHVAFTYARDIWVSELDGSNVVRITSTPAIESNPALSPDGSKIAFTSNRSGTFAVYVVSSQGGTPQRLTWHPSTAAVLGWSKDGSQIYYASSRDFAPNPSNRIWMIPAEGGNPTLLTQQRGFNASFSPDESQVVLEPVSRWDSEWRNYRGGQNTPLVILDLASQEEILIPNEHTTDIFPVWGNDKIYFLSDRDGVMNIWSYEVATAQLTQVTTYSGSDIKWLSGGDQLAFERDGYLFTMDPASKEITQLSINIIGDFPWAETKWEDIGRRASSASLSPSGKRIVVEARGDIFTIPVEHGDARNLTHTSGAADRRPLWSPNGGKIAWFSDEGHQPYRLMLADQDGMTAPEEISIGESKLVWEPTWSPDGEHIAFVDDDVRVRVLNIESKEIWTIGLGGINIERGDMGLTWSPDSKWLAYSKTGNNNFRQIMIWSAVENKTTALTNAFANASSPAWDQDGKHFYFLASTDVALGSGWTNTSSMTADPEYAVYVVNLDKTDPSPFILRSDEEKVKEGKEEKGEDDEEEEKEEKAEEEKGITIDFDNVERRIIAMPLPESDYRFLVAGPKGTLFIAENDPNSPGLTIHKFDLEERESKEYLGGVRSLSATPDGNMLLARVGDSWKVLDAKKPAEAGERVAISLEVKLDREAEWKQIFEETWRYERDYFYDPNLHGRDWDVVYERYAPLLPFVKHRSDLTYLLDQINGELSVGHSFVGGGDFPDVESNKTGLLGADLVQDGERWKIKRIYTTENWNPDLTSPLDQPGLNIKEGYYLVGINGKELSAQDNPFEFLDGTLSKQTTLHLSETQSFADSWTEIVKPIRSEVGLRQRAWVENNRRLVDSLSNGRLAYVWVPNTSGQGLVSFNRYFFAQQDKEGAVIDERFNGGGLLDDYMVDLMTRTVRAGYTNEIPGAAPRVMPGGILGPKVLLINEMAGSGGDFFPWVFRQQQAGLLIGMTTWGGLVKSSTHYGMIDGGRVTAPDNAIFDPAKNEWIGENVGIAPDIEVRQDAQSLTEGRDPQLERAVEELMKQLPDSPVEITAPPYSTPAIHKE